MVGLFWIEGDVAYVGTPAVDPAPSVVLTPDGPRVRGSEPLEWSWGEVTDLRVPDAPVRSTAVRWAARAASFAVAALDAWVPEEPPEMTVVIAAGGVEVETSVYSGASVAYTQREVDLSLGLLARMVRGEFSPVVMSEWWRVNQPEKVLSSREREIVLEGWLAEEWLAEG
ncbi:hypothetical protein IAG44_22245 [Streptomyces roseirectus]|uniref:Uncharacterized protein n=2 Tax=Streptomyces roseirectus TaxID=2768066 RepID=A0A7H0ISY4_9ACTN|nr:hypothetical protein IAG44_22245 [Streptomyces roseirectus]